MRETSSLKPQASSLKPRRFLRRASIMILVVVVVVLLAVLGMAYMQLVRVDRLATARPAGGAAQHGLTNNIDQVVAAAIEKIRTTLREDIVNNAGQMLNPAAAGTGGYDEAYDYPWTNPDPAVIWAVDPQYGAAANARGGQLDDMWLASSYPRVNGAGNLEWPHITNLNGIFLNIPAAGGGYKTPGDTGANGEFVVDFASQEQTDTNRDVAFLQGTPHATNYLPRGADADGDGIPDSRWTWAPIREIAGVNYIMAVRIIDNSAMVNVNAATAILDNTGTYGAGVAATDRPVGLWPSSVDLSRLLARTSGANINSVAVAMRALQEWRLPTVAPAPAIGGYLSPTRTDFTVATGDVLDPPLGGGAASQLRQYWDNLAVYAYPLLPQLPVPYPAGQGRAKFGWADEVNLRYGNGLRSDRFGRTPLESCLYDSGAYDFLRTVGTSGPNNEQTISDVTRALNLSPSWQPDNEAHVRAFFVGANGAGALTGVPEIRKWLTTYSGAMALVSYGGGPLDFTPKVDLSPERVTSAAWTPAIRDAALTQLSTALRGVFNAGSGTSTYLGLSNADADNLADQFAANIFDYLDNDDTPIVVPGTANYGLERLPFLREAYWQVRYVATEGSDIDGEVGAWNLILGNNVLGWVVELGNPFDQSVEKLVDPTTGLNPRVQIRFTTSDGSAQRIWQWSLAAGAVIPAGGTLVLYSNPSNGSSDETQLNNLSYVITGTATPLPPDAASGSALVQFTSKTVIVELQVDTPGGWITYDRMEIGNMPDNPKGVTNSNASLGDERHVQIAAARPCEDAGAAGNYYLDDGSTSMLFTRDLEDSTLKNAGDTNLGSDNKGIAVSPDTQNLSTVVLRVADRPIYNVAELGWISTIGFSATKTFTDNVADMLHSLSPAAETTGTAPQRIPRGLFLDFTTQATIIPLAANLPQVSHAALALDQITVSSPQNDGVDNDDDDGDNDHTTHQDGANDAQGPYELFVPGTINVNTVPPEILAAALPLPESLGELYEFAGAIEAYRLNLAGGDRAGMVGRSGTRSQPGIASLGELMWLYMAINYPPVNAQRYAVDVATQWNSNFSLRPLPGEAAGATIVQGKNDDTEERMARFQFLTQVLSTRSDVFTAYVEIRGYPADDWRKGPVESARFLAVFDRGRLAAPTDPDAPVHVRLLGLYRY